MDILSFHPNILLTKQIIEKIIIDSGQLQPWEAVFDVTNGRTVHSLELCNGNPLLLLGDSFGGGTDGSLFVIT